MEKDFRQKMIEFVQALGEDLIVNAEKYVDSQYMTKTQPDECESCRIMFEESEDPYD